MEVICIDAKSRSDINWKLKNLTEGKIYTVRKIEHYGRGPGYLLKGVYNTDIKIIGFPGKEPGYDIKRFIETSDIDETKIIELLTEKSF